MRRRFGDQSAMEYLLTYGWAILIIAVILVVLFQLHIFEPAAYFACLGQPGFLCSLPSLSSGGALTVNLSYNGYNYPITITALYCNVTSSPSSKPPSVETTSIAVKPGQQVQLVFQCPITNTRIGSTSSVFLSIYYNTPTINNLQQNFAKGVLPVTYAGDITWDVSEWTPSSNAVGMFLGYGTSGVSVIGPRNGYLYWENASPSIYSVNSSSSPNLTSISGSFSPPSKTYNIWSYIWSNGNEQTQLNYNSKASASSTLYSPTQLNQFAFMINPSAGTTELDAYWVRDRSYPPSGIMPSQGGFGSVSNSNVVESIINSHGFTGTNFQQEVNFNPSSYSSHETSGLGNIRFYLNTPSTPNALYSWCESGCNSSSSSAVFWVNIPSGLGSGAANSIDMEFSGSATYDGYYAGEAPQLSPSYAQYDNGAEVFPLFYDNFAGTSLNSKWTQGEGITATVNSGLQLSGGVAYGASISGIIPPGNTIIESDYEMAQTPTTSPQLLSYADLNPALGVPVSTTLLNSTVWTSFSYGNLAGWSYSTDYHNHDVYNGIETSLFPLHQLSEDDAPCSAPWASHGYTANATANMSGTYTFNIWTDDGTEIFYKTVSGSTWNSVFGGAAWKGQPDTEYSNTVTLSKGQYSLVVEFTDICDPAGLSVVQISPPPST
jgi:hypothetical protein